jgi:uncharacterized membrane protein YczE
MMVVAGSILIAVGVSLLARARLGLASWSVLADGISQKTGLGLGTSSTIVTLGILLCWVPLKVRPGVGTVIVSCLIGPAMNLAIEWVPGPETMLGRVGFVGGSIALVAVGTGLYISVDWGPGARDGLMTGLRDATGWPIGRARTLIEVAVVSVGFALGGTLGAGSVVFTLLIGPTVQRSLVFWDRFQYESAAGMGRQIQR